MRERLLTKLAQVHSERPRTMLLIVIVLTIVFAGLSTQLRVAMRWSDLLPEKDPKTVQFNKIIKDFKSSTSIVVVVQGDENKIKEFADFVAPKILTAVDTSLNENIKNQIAKLQAKKGKSSQADEIENQIVELTSQISKPLVQRVDYKMEVDYIRNHGLMLIKEDDLKNSQDIFYDPNISNLLFNLNNAMEKEYIGKSESISGRKKEDDAFRFLNGIEDFVSLLAQTSRNQNVSQQDVQKTIDSFLIGDPYFVSYDKKALILNVIPTFSMTDAHMMIVGTEVVRNIINKALKQFPEVHAGLTGMVPIGHDEMVYSEQSLGVTSVIAFVAILLMLMITFRMWIAPIFAMVNLFVGIIWAIGVTVIFVGQLNLMTYMMTVILIGLGIDFSIHIISAFTEMRAQGTSIYESLKSTFLKAGKGVITGAVTTSFAFLSLIISSSRGMKEMGIVTGTGLLAILVATFLFLPILLVLRERRVDKKLSLNTRKQSDITFTFLGKWAQLLGRKYIFTIIGAIVVTVTMAFFGSKLTFDHNYMNIEPEGLESIALQDTVMDKFDLGMDYALIIADGVQDSRNLSEKYKKMNSVAMTEDISVYLPSQQQYLNRTPLVNTIKEKMQSAKVKSSVSSDDLNTILQELDRLNMNIIEMQDMAYIGGQDKVDNKCEELVGDPENEKSINYITELIDLISQNRKQNRQSLSRLQSTFSPLYKSTVIKMASSSPMSLADLPETIVDRYANADRDKFLVTVFPAGNIWQDAKFLYRFVDDLESVSHKATGMPPVFKALIQVIGRDGRYAIFLTLAIMFIFLWIDFRDYKLSLMAMVPLAVGIVWMIGLMHLTSQQLTVMNVMGLPMIIGIGIDDGVHIVHRWQSEGKNKLKTIFASTGKAILLTSLTTMLAFGSLTFSIWRGFGQLGSALFVGVAACFLSTVLILPAIIQFRDSRTGK